jgi:hypothetical protein
MWLWCLQAGETPAEAAARNVLRELKIEISPSRFKYLCHASLLWQFRQQEPRGDNCSVTPIYSTDANLVLHVTQQLPTFKDTASRKTALQSISHQPEILPVLQIKSLSFAEGRTP